VLFEKFEAELKEICSEIQKRHEIEFVEIGLDDNQVLFRLIN